MLRPGEDIPVDGVILEGSSAVNEAALTGESIPVDKTVGDDVSAATINQSGFIRCEATRVGVDTTLSQIIKMVSDAAATKAPIAKIADKVSGGVRTGSHFHRGGYLYRMALNWKGIQLCAGKRNFRTGDQLSMCTGTCNAGSNYGRKRRGCEERYLI